nr:ATPase, AAA-type, core, P-loop containing nucleoside triphosphate hydrolase [Tanacetum cinerariifolium]
MLPQGVLLYGPRGTGKSTLVHALAREAKASFFPISAWDIANGDVSIEKLFRKARICSPSVVFIEDIDVIAKNQGDNQSWPEITLSDPAITKLHTEMDKCVKDGTMVVVIASTNKQETLDPYLFESPWFNRLFHVAKPDEDCRRKACGLYLKDNVKEEDKEAICDSVASLTPDVVWAHLQLIANISIIDAVYLDDRHVTKDDVLQAIKGSVLLFRKDGPTT